MSSNDDGANSAGPRKWRRSFLATRSAHTEADSPPVRAEKIDPAPPVPTDTEEDDIPVLTDRVAAEEEEEEKGRVVETPTVVEAPVIVEVPAPPDREGIEALA
ncbi:MAG: hypothetical protein LBI62_02215, partial [Candidatus Accumulibacter sp.]|nr:hypothetical protein [Accumulibacter sp.]